VSCEEGTLCVDCQRELEETLRELGEVNLVDACPDHDNPNCHICTVEDYDC